MAKRVKHSTDRSKLVDGCGNILKTDRLKGGYRLVKRKRGAKSTATATATATKGKVGRPKGSKNKMTTSAPVMAKTTAKTPRTGKRKLNAFFQAKAKAIKSGSNSFMYEGQKYVAGKTKTGMTIFKKAGRGISKATASTMTTAPKGKRGRPKGSTNKMTMTAPVMMSASKGKVGRPKGSTNKMQKRRANKKTA